MEKGGLLVKFQFLLISHSVFINISWLYCFIKKIHYVPFSYYLCVFQFDALSRKKGVSCKIPIFTNISFGFCQNFMKLHGYIVYKKFKWNCLFYLSKSLLLEMSFTVGIVALDSQTKHFQVS